MFAIFPEILQLAQRGDLETLACLVRKYFGDRQIYAPRLRVEPLLGSLGISLTRESAPYFARLQVLDVKGQYHIAISLDARTHDLLEVNFTLAHLIGYFLIAIQPLMARGEITAEAYQLESGALSRLLGTASTHSRSARSAQSLAADGFAKALLMPLGMVKKASEKLGSTQDLAGFFQVRPELMQMRLEQTKIGKERAELKAEPRPAGAKSKAEVSPLPPARPSSPSLPPSPLSRKPKPDQDSLMRVQKSVAKLGYQKEERRAQSEPSPKSESGRSENRDQRKEIEIEQRPSGGLQRLRQLAKKIDKTVDDL